MIRTEKFDEFFNRQPEREFVNLLKEPVHTYKPATFGKRAIEEGEINASGMYLTGDFPDPEGVLETAYDDFNLFLNVYEIAGKEYPVRLAKGETRCFEAYTVEIAADGITLTAADTEGIRRGLIYIEDRITSGEAPFLLPEKTERWPHIKERITRGFFSPTNRPPKFGDELFDDIEYYPDEYLNRLAHDGTNGLWIYTRFKDLLPPGMIPEYGEGHEKRLEKLRRIIKNCARYGVKVYVFAMEPAAFETWEMLNKYPQIWGNTTWDLKKCFCANTEFGRNYCIDSSETMCKLLPGLGGFLSITAGERNTNCSGGVSDTGESDCPNCHGIPKGQILAQAIDCIQEGIRRSGTNLPYISWTYGHRAWKQKDIDDYVDAIPSDVILMQNFDDMGVVDQLGRNRVGVDYWLSYPGPSPLFRKTAERARKLGKTMYAKTQVCCSHEVATVPYIPTPGIIFEKWKGMHELGVSGVMECWYFGNYPSFMTKAAGELSFCHDFSDEEGFLNRLAAIYWGKSRAAEVAKAWKLFAEGYKKYPLNIMYSYYGPMHDGITWELQLLPKNFSLPRSWYSTDKPDGDRIDESMQTGHNIDEIVTLTEELVKFWKEGMAVLDGIEKDGGYITEEQISCSTALDILFESGYNITKFYQLREKMGFGEVDAAETLRKMRALVEREIELSHKMVKLNRADMRLGYHSEAENYKFFPEKIEYRITKLEELLKTEFPVVEKRIRDGLTPLAYYEGEEEGIPHYNMGHGTIENAEWVDLLDGTSRFRVSYDAENIYLEIEGSEKKRIQVTPEFTLMHAAPSVLIDADGTLVNGWNNGMYFSMIIENRLEEYAKKWKLTSIPSEGFHHLITLNRKDFGWEKTRPMKLRIGEAIRETIPTLWVKEEDPVHVLGKHESSPGEYGWLMP
ncbi:MAG: hypothetical protein IJN74_08330 [Clostridia bacterium]|nr:hypothetical protein [Clostridia bacterium]